MNLDLLGLFQSPAVLQPRQVPSASNNLPPVARLRYPLRNHLYRVFVTCSLVVMAIFTLEWPFLGVGLLVGCAALYWRGLSLSYGPDALEISWRLHKLARICWSQIFRIDVSPRGQLVLSEKDRVTLKVDRDLEGFDALCAMILKKAPAEIRICPAASQLLLQQARLQEGELVALYGPHFLAEPAIHSHLWNPGVDPYESWCAVGFGLAGRILQAGRKLSPFVISWNRVGKTVVSAGSAIPAESRAWVRVTSEAGILTAEVDYEGYGVRVYPQPA